jgi:hypothetical protein
MPSQLFNMRLLELVAMVIHDLAGNLYATFRPDGEPPYVGGFASPGRFTYLDGEPRISLSTGCYCHTRSYPRGKLDEVGYWAEVHIFGGVVVFDRGPDEAARNVRNFQPTAELQMWLKY